MGTTTFCDNSGISALVLVLAHKQAAAHGADPRLLFPRPRVMQVIRILGRCSAQCRCGEAKLPAGRPLRGELVGRS